MSAFESPNHVELPTQSVESTPQRAELKEATLRGARALTAVRAFAQVVRFGSSVVVAHFVAPDEFGRAAIALVLCSFAQTLAGQGFGAPLVQRKDIARADLEVAVFVSAVTGCLISLGIFVLGPLAVEPLFGHATAALIQLAGLAFALTGLSVIPQALLQRHLSFRRISYIEGASEFVLAAVTILLALAGLGANAIILGALAGVATVTILSLACAPAAWPRWHRGKARDIASFGAPAGLAGLLNVGYRNIDYLILGAMMPAAQVGYYFRAFSLGVDYQQKISGIAVRVAFPVYSRARDLADMRAIRARLGRAQATLVFPLLGLLIALAPEVVPAVFGARWKPAVVPSQILALGGMLTLMRMTTAPFLLALGRPRALLGFNGFSAVFYGLAIFAAAPLGVNFVCVIVVVTQVVLLAGAFGLLMHVGGVSLGEIWQEGAAATFGSCALVAVAWPLALFLQHAGIPNVATVGACGLIGLVVYAVVLKCFFPAAWTDFRLVVARVLPRVRIPSLPARRRRPEPPRTRDPRPATANSLQAHEIDLATAGPNRARETDRTGSTEMADLPAVGIHVLGMHRSGTSATTRALNLLGIPTCVETDFMPGLKGNPRGHYESSTLVEVNTQLIIEKGRTWWCPPPTDTSWTIAASMSGAAARDAFLSVHPTAQWISKDPRTCLTLPFWLDVLPGRAAAIIVNRNPLEIAMSLEKRDRFPRAFSLALWERHIRSALAYSAGLPVFVTDYDDLLNNPDSWCSDVAGFLDSLGVRFDAGGASAVAASLEHGLRHSRITLRDLREDPTVSSDQAELYSELRNLSGSWLSFEPPALPPEDPKVEAQILGFSRLHRLAARRIRLTVGSSAANLRRHARTFPSAPERA